MAYRWLYLIPSAGRQRAYLSYVLRHKYYVFVEALKLGVPPHIAFLHDWSKFRLDEWRGYSMAFNEPDGTRQYNESFLVVPWNDHQKRNKHHWQYWMITWDRGETDLLPMPDLYRREMLADWCGAGKALGFPDTKGWYLKNQDKMKLHPDTRAWIEKQLGIEHEAT